MSGAPDRMAFGRTCEEQLAFRKWADARGGDMKLYDGAVLHGPDRWSHGTLNESIGMAAVGASRWANSLTVNEGDVVEFDGDTFRVVT